ncbi:glycosyltransferase [Vibrio atlanticus]|uniref:glycosyltransferase n=1 Tax=Vibrio atlanticus TaxID=693153 RepID=UPI000EFD1925|nr:glycosyltransferase [Vibrio atlanticus]
MKYSKPQVAVLLAAYNGEQYIAEQIDTIIAQKEVQVSIIISVDKSSDRTLIIAQEYEVKYPGIVTVLPYGNKYGSAGQNFARLLLDVDFSNYQYISFADQDDIWLPGKLQRAVAELESKCADAYSSNVTAFWETGREVLVKKNYKQVEFDYLFESPGPGCTFLFSQHLVIALQKHLISKKSELEQLWMHDWYCYSFARFNEFKWYIDSAPLMRYRQHGGNEVGANEGWLSFKNRFKIILSGSGFSKVLTQAYFIGQSELEPIKLIENRSRFSMCRLLFITWKCRRQFSHKAMLSVACLLFIIIGFSHRKPE